MLKTNLWALHALTWQSPCRKTFQMSFRHSQILDVDEACVNACWPNKTWNCGVSLTWFSLIVTWRDNVYVTTKPVKSDTSGIHFFWYKTMNYGNVEGAHTLTRPCHWLDRPVNFYACFVPSHKQRTMCTNEKIVRWETKGYQKTNKNNEHKSEEENPPPKKTNCLNKFFWTISVGFLTRVARKKAKIRANFSKTTMQPRWCLSSVFQDWGWCLGSNKHKQLFWLTMWIMNKINDWKVG